jgi:hypothetical protein
MDESAASVHHLLLAYTLMMIDWLRPLWLMFYSPARGMSEARDRAPLVPAMVIAFVAQTGYLFFTEWLYRHGSVGLRSLLL